MIFPNVLTRNFDQHFKIFHRFILAQKEHKTLFDKNLHTKKGLSTLLKTCSISYTQKTYKKMDLIQPTNLKFFHFFFKAKKKKKIYKNDQEKRKPFQIIRQNKPGK